MNIDILKNEIDSRKAEKQALEEKYMNASPDANRPAPNLNGMSFISDLVSSFNNGTPGHASNSLRQINEATVNMYNQQPQQQYRQPQQQYQQPQQNNGDDGFLGLNINGLNSNISKRVNLNQPEQQPYQGQIPVMPMPEGRNVANRDEDDLLFDRNIEMQKRNYMQNMQQQQYPQPQYPQPQQPQVMNEQYQQPQQSQNLNEHIQKQVAYMLSEQMGSMIRSALNDTVLSIQSEEKLVKMLKESSEVRTEVDRIVRASIIKLSKVKPKS